VKYVSEKAGFDALSARDQRAFRYLFTLLDQGDRIVDLRE
jgi:hypothetical protein